MKSECDQRDLTVYCIRISDIRFVRGEDNPDIKAMKKLTKAFGPDFWKTTIIVLTFTNLLEALNEEWKILPPEGKAKEYVAKVRDWEIGIKEILVEDIQVPEKIARNIDIVPAGYKMLHLPGYPFWLSNLWFHCLSTISTPEKQAALILLSSERFKEKEQITQGDSIIQPEQQPIIIVIPRKSKMQQYVSIAMKTVLCRHVD